MKRVLAAFLAALLLSGDALGAIALDSAGTLNFAAAAGTSITFAHTTSGSNRLLVVHVALAPAVDEAVTGVTYNGVAMTQGAAHGSAVAGVKTYLYYLAAPATGANNVVVSLSAATSGAGAVATSWTGVDQGSPVRAAAGDAAGGAVTAGATSSAGDVVLDVVGSNDTFGCIGIVHTASQTVVDSQCDPLVAVLEMGASYKTGGAGTTTMSWSGGDKMALSAMAIKASGSSTPAAPAPSQSRWYSPGGGSVSPWYRN